MIRRDIIMIEKMSFNKRYKGSKGVIVYFDKEIPEGKYDVVLIPKGSLNKSKTKEGIK